MAYTDNPADNRARLDAIEEQVRLTAEQIREARTPQAWGTAAKVVKSFASQANGVQTPFRRPGEFFQAVKHINSRQMDWRQHALMKSYVEGCDRQYEEITKSYARTGKSVPTGLNESVGTDGGFLVPPQFVQQLLQRTYENDLLSRTTLFPMTSNILKIPAISETSRANGSRFGGIQAFWEGEGQAPDYSKPGFTQIQLNPARLSLLVKATDELLEDSGVALETYIETVASQELQFKVGDALVNGSGVGMPEGILKAACKVKVSKEAGQPANTVLTENIVKMWSRLFIGARQNAVWLVNQEVEPQLQTMTLGVGTGGVVTYMPPGGLSAAPYATLLGKPVIVTEFNSALGTEGDIILCDLSTMLSGTRGGMQSAVSMHVFFSTNEQAFRFTMRLDCRSWWLSALTKYKGNDTVSPIVTLETRS